MGSQNFNSWGATSVETLDLPSTSQPATQNSLVVAGSLDLRLRKRALTNKPTSEFDNFYTPENSFFYSKSPYLALDSKRREIRLLRVFPRKSYSNHVKANPQWTPTDGLTGQPLQVNAYTYLNFGIRDPESRLIACELVDKVALSRIDGTYCALSYCAGKPTETAVILVDGIPFNAFANLEHAIGHALECWTSRNPGRELLLWADQICINQRDQMERESQVGMMRDIYRRSNETFVCLSTSSLTNCLSWVPRNRYKAAGMLPSHVKTQESGVISEVKNSIREKMLSMHEAELTTDSKTDPWLVSLQAFITCPWWRRAWVYQEFIASPRPYLLSGSESVPWSEISPVIDFICSGFDEFLDLMIDDITGDITTAARLQDEERMRDEAKAKLEHENHLSQYQQEMDRYQEDLERYREKMDQNRQEWQKYDERRREDWQTEWQIQQAKREEYMMQRRLQLDQEAAALEREKNDTNPLNFPARLKQTHQKERLQCWRALLQQDIHEQISRLDKRCFLNCGIPTREEQELYQELVELRKLVMIPDDWLLFYPSFPSPQLPRPEQLQAFGEYNGISRNASRLLTCFHGPQLLGPEQLEAFEEAGPDLPPTVEEDGRVPRDKLSFRPTFPNLEPPIRPVMPIITSSRVSRSSQNSGRLQAKKTYTRSLQTHFRKLDLSIICSVMKGKKNARRSLDLKTLLWHSRNCDASDPRDRVYAFLGLAHKGYAIVPDYTSKNTVVHVLIETARRIIKYEKTLNILEHVCHGRENLGSFLPTWVPDWTTKEIDCDFKEYASLLTPGQDGRLFDASKGLRIEAEFRTDEANEANVDMKVKGVLVDILDELEGSVRGFEDLSSFLTPGSQRIITPKSALLDDEVWVLHGASKPVVLRPEDDDTYGFLGEVIVFENDGALSDIMFGQMVELVNQGTAETRECWLV
jgi:hypothetical protein